METASGPLGVVDKPAAAQSGAIKLARQYGEALVTWDPTVKLWRMPRRLVSRLGLLERSCKDSQIWQPALAIC
jgi:hypothetical protein